MGDVVVAYYREEGVDNLVVRHRDRFLVRIGQGYVFVFVDLAVVVRNIAVLGLPEEGIQGEVILGLGVGQVSQVGVEQVVLFQADGQHLVQAAGVCGEVAVCANDEGVVFICKQDRVVHLVLVEQIGHLYALFYGCSSHQDTLRANLVSQFLTGDQREKSEKNIKGNACFHTTRHI